ncbi:S-adenosylmethionine mitochondrial carrier protein [Daphnia magna]|uniref:S-adenosylmethionine mitochondrial carrier protein n=1 Tax=Daphnia magna TaxID=35525 RepID=UPI0006E0970A|nr:S-adenosylmethionine mitochondrial carrier protein [Daphnia magna]XP_045025685.1 S-adenosylmethionine mitochondrial carrier protein [Daphnia magna]XP_045025686.1 S-adenosylmethionine mitochondrial carrier protein [Daphnia magna]
MSIEIDSNVSIRNFLAAGGIAGMAVDAGLFPLDTLKTRLQSPDGFVKSGGFRGVYSGLGTAVLGSAPTAALFFCTYENTKRLLKHNGVFTVWEPVVHMTSAAFGEVAACMVRVPVEVVKQRRQAGFHSSSVHIFRSILRSEGIAGLYRGYTTTVLREIPFSFIQFPLWEGMKSFWSEKQGRPVSPWQSSICGALSGGLAAAVTTPLDVAKTRIMLADSASIEAGGKLMIVLRSIYFAQGIKGLFAGIVPRVLWISIGGAIFLGVYDKALTTLNS